MAYVAAGPAPTRRRRPTCTATSASEGSSDREGSTYSLNTLASLGGTPRTCAGHGTYGCDGGGSGGAAVSNQLAQCSSYAPAPAAPLAQPPMRRPLNTSPLAPSRPSQLSGTATHLCQHAGDGAKRHALDGGERLGGGGNEVGQHPLQPRLVIAVGGGVAQQPHHARLVLLQAAAAQQRAQQHRHQHHAVLLLGRRLRRRPLCLLRCLMCELAVLKGRPLGMAH